MAMTVMYNAGARLSLIELNQNNNEAAKALAKVSSGMKINSAADDASGYSISERMRVQLRALTQDNQNVQNGSSIIRTAERGIDQIIQNMRTMKEKAINAANDSNTDEDRQTIQKEFNQLRETIDDIAIGTQYNGKILLDGRYAKPVFSTAEIKDVVNAFKASYNSVEQKGSLYSYSGTTDDPANWKFAVDKSFINSTTGAFSVELDFSAMIAEGGTYPEALHNQGFSILCGGCPQYINILFNANKTAAQSTYNKTANSSANGTVNDMAREFIIGVKDVKSSEDLAEVLFQGISAVSSSIEKSFNSTLMGTKTATHTNTSDDILVNAAHNLRIRRDPNDSSKILFTKDSNAMQFRNGIIKNPDLEELEEFNKRKTGPLWIQHGTQAGQHSNFYIEDMQTKSLGAGQLFNGGRLINESDIARYNALNDNTAKQAEWLATLKAAENKTIDDISVTTKENANIAIRVLDGALEYALDQATRMGAYLQRLEFTDINVTTMGENVQASESTIRDADMAKEMTSYTKANVLAQAAQSMLAQANQNSSAILNLLQ